MLSKLFNWKKKPKKSGTFDAPPVDGGVYRKKFQLELSNMEGAPVYAFTNQLTLGSEIGNIVVADPSISPRHATFLLQEDVVSVIDHGSVSGTSVNGTKITPGRYIILEETDRILVGDLEVRIVVTNELVEEDSLDTPPPVETATPAMPSPDDIPTAPTESEAKPAPAVDVKALKAAAKKRKKKNLTLASVSATNSLVRVFAVLGDFVLAYCVYVIMAPFDEFRQFLIQVPEVLSDILGFQWSALYEMARNDLGIEQSMIDDLLTMLPPLDYVLCLVVLFVLIRFVTTLFFGCSISELFLGVRSAGNALWARVGGALRVILGVITGPFLIFDLPALFSKRTVKELLTFTNTFVDSKVISIIGFVIYFPILIVALLLSPLVIGLELPEPIAVDDVIERRVKVAAQAPIEGAVEEQPVLFSSDYFLLKLPLKPSEVSLIPDFNFKGNGQNLVFQGDMVFYYPDLQRSVKLRLFKKFSMKELVAMAIHGNYMLAEKYPELSNYVHESPEAQKLFMSSMTDKSHDAFSNQFISLTKSSLGLSIENFVETMESETVQLQGLVDFKSTLLGLIEYKNFDRLGLAKIGNNLCLKVSFNRQKPFDLFIPLVKGQGRIYLVEYDKKDDLSTLSNRFYKFSLNDVSYFPERTEAQETLTPFQVIDVLSKMKLSAPLDMTQAQALYGYFFETSGKILNRGDMLEISVWKNAVEDTQKIIDKMSSMGQDPTEEKLRQNFKDLGQALESGNKEYFGLQATTI